MANAVPAVIAVAEIEAGIASLQAQKLQIVANAKAQVETLDAVEYVLNQLLLPYRKAQALAQAQDQVRLQSQARGDGAAFAEPIPAPGELPSLPMEIA